MIEFYILETKKNSYNKKDVCLKKKSLKFIINKIQINLK